MVRLAKLTPARFRMALVAVLGAVFALLQLAANVASSSPPARALAWQHDGRLHVFVHPDCPHCHKAIAFLKAQPGIEFVLHDVSTPANEELLRTVAGQHSIPERDLGVPLFVRGSRYLIGFESAQTTGRELWRSPATKPQSLAPMLRESGCRCSETSTRPGIPCWRSPR